MKNVYPRRHNVTCAVYPSDYTVNYAIVIIVFTNINVTNSKLKNVVAEQE